jgi:Amt family ammonium transporter
MKLKMKGEVKMIGTKLNQRLSSLGCLGASLGVSAAAFLASGLAQAQTAPAVPAPVINSGDTAWVLAATAMVLLMTPGLAFFYAGMVRTKNVTATLFQSYVALSAIGVLWCIVGYSLAFSGKGSFVGDLNWIFLRGVDQTPYPDYSTTIPHILFMAFQAMFAIITPALITGAIAERLSFKGWILFSCLWSLAVYAPVAHWVWSVGGWIRAMGGLDFAGGLVVHMTAGYSALAAAIALGKRRDFGKVDAKPYDAGYVLLGTGLLWFGWFGFNSGSALSANGLAAQAFINTFLAAATGGLAWMVVDTFVKGKPSAIGFGIGVVAGLVVITPACGFVSTGVSLLFGLAAGSLCNFAAILVKEKFKIDDTLDVFACHGVGGTLGTILTGVFALKSINEGGADGLLAGSSTVLMANLAGSAAVAIFSAGLTFVLIKAVSLVAPLRITDSDEQTGLDLTQHGEVINSAIVKDIHSRQDPKKHAA